MAERDRERDNPSLDGALTPDQKIVQEAKDRFKRVQDWESNFRSLYVIDVKFANGDSDNGWQWPDDLRKDREINKRPSLTINKTAQLVAQITHAARENRPGITIKPTGDESTYDAAEVFEGVVRQIEYASAAQTIYDEAVESQVEGGIAYWRVGTEYVDDQSFDQDIRIMPVRDHLSVYLDCDIKQRDGSDAKYGFIIDEIPETEFERLYPDIPIPSGTGLDMDDDWVLDGNVRLAEYYRIVEKDDELIFMEDEQGQSAKFYRSEVPVRMRAALKAAEENAPERIKRRKVKTKKLEWFKIAAGEIIDRRDGKDGTQALKGSYIPIVRVVGKERVIQGRLERKGHVRNLKDPQRMYNYNSSGQIEFGALATKSPWVGPAEAFAGNEPAWNNANRMNAAYLTYKHKDEDGEPLPAPTRPEPPGASPAFIEGMRIASAELEMASGQYEAQNQNPAIERTPAAINQRVLQGDKVSGVYLGNLAIAIRLTGKIILDLVPHIYDTERIIQILGKDGTQSAVKVDPEAKQSYIEQKDRDEVQAIFNPNVGKYAVEADVGPAFGTKRQEAWNAFVNISTGAPEFLNEFGDLMFLSADFPSADKIAERFRRKLEAEKPYLFDDKAPTPGMQQLQAQNAELQQSVNKSQATVADLLEKLAEYKLTLKGKEQMRDIEAYEAESKRLTAETNAIVDLKSIEDVGQLKPLIQQTIAEMMGFKLSEVEAPNSQGAM